MLISERIKSMLHLNNKDKLTFHILASTAHTGEHFLSFKEETVLHNAESFRQIRETRTKQNPQNAHSQARNVAAKWGTVYCVLGKGEILCTKLTANDPALSRPITSWLH